MDRRGETCEVHLEGCSDSALSSVSCRIESHGPVDRIIFTGAAGVYPLSFLISTTMQTNKVLAQP
jgi:hypothetical protein